MFLEHSYYLSKTKLILILITVKIKIHFFQGRKYYFYFEHPFCIKSKFAKQNLAQPSAFLFLFKIMAYFICNSF